MRVTASADRVDERVEAVLTALFERPDFQRALAEAHRRRETAATKGPDVASLMAEREDEFEAVEKLREAGELTLRAYAAETRRIEEAISRLRSRQAAAVSSPSLRRLLTAASLQDGWKKADLMDRREVVRLLVDVTIRRATVRGRTFDPRRVEVRPSAFLTSGDTNPGDGVDI
jgi:site-specific DNA recombinase